MIPALLISTAAGLLVTRVGEMGRELRLGEQISRQVTAEPRALAAAATLLVALAFVRGLPAWPFLGLGGVLATVAVNRFLRERKRPQGNFPPDDVLVRFGGTATRVEIGRELFRELSRRLPAGTTWRSVSNDTTLKLRSRFGLPISAIPFVGNGELDAREVTLKIRGGVAERMTVPYDAAYHPSSRDSLKQVGVRSLAPAGGTGHWISVDDVSLLNAAKMPVYPLWPAVYQITETWLGGAARRLIGVDETQVLVDRVARERPALIRETVPKRIDLPTLSGLLGRLVEEGIHLDLLPEMLETLSRTNPRADLDALVEEVRVGLAFAITAGLRSSDGVVRVMLLDESLTSVIEAGLIRSDKGVSLALSREDVSALIETLKSAAERTETSVLVTDPHIRRPLAVLIRASLPAFSVLKTTEIEASTRAEVMAEVSI
jgi:flagellar biosynthesis component FlhA